MNLDGFALPVKELKGTDPVEMLDLSGKNLGVASAVVIASLIGVNGGLTSLNLSDNQLCGLDNRGRGTYTAEGITAIADALRVNGALTALNLSSNHLEDEGVRAVCKAIQSNKETKLASLNMVFNSIGPVGAKSVAAMVAVTCTLIECNLSNNDMGEEGKAPICFAVQGKAGFHLHL